MIYEVKKYMSKCSCCGSKMERGAEVCPRCKSSQTKLKHYYGNRDVIRSLLIVACVTASVIIGIVCAVKFAREIAPIVNDANAGNITHDSELGTVQDKEKYMLSCYDVKVKDATNDIDTYFGIDARIEMDVISYIWDSDTAIIVTCIDDNDIFDVMVTGIEEDDLPDLVNRLIVYGEISENTLENEAKIPKISARLIFVDNDNITID